MKSNLLLAFAFSCLLYSCSGYKTMPGVTVNNVDGYLKVKVPEKDISITYYGDYWFHPLNRKQTLNWSNELINLINENSKRQILYVTHTTIEPYCSSIGILYKDTAISKFIQNESMILREKYKARNLKKEGREVIGSKSYVKLLYDMHDYTLKVNQKCMEYYTTCDGYILRVIFWTMESYREEWLRDESVGIIKTIQSDF